MLNGDVLARLDEFDRKLDAWTGRMEAFLGIKLDAANNAITSIVQKQAAEIEQLSVTNARLEAELAAATERQPASVPLHPRVQAALVRRSIGLPHDVQRVMRQQAWAMTQEGLTPDQIVDRIETGDVARVGPLLSEV